MQPPETEALRLLLVGTDAATVASATSAAETLGYFRHHTDDRQTALKLSAQDPYDLVLVAWSLLDRGGDAFCAAIRAQHPDHTCLIAALIDPHAVAQVAEIMAAGADDCLVKPLTAEALRARLLVLAQRLARRRHRLVAKARFARVVAGADEAIWDWNLQAGRMYYAPRWQELFGFDTQASADPALWLDRIHPADRSRFDAALRTHCRGLSDVFVCEHRLRVGNAPTDYRWVRARGRAVFDARGRAGKLAGSLTDLGRRGAFDPRTGLPGRRLFLERIGIAIRRNLRDAQHQYAVACLAIEGYAGLVDVWGESQLDTVLHALARKLEATFAESGFVARLGEAEFAVLVSEASPVVELGAWLQAQLQHQARGCSGPNAHPLSFAVGVTTGARAYG